jgi:hypothetical protein
MKTQSENPAAASSHVIVVAPQKNMGMAILLTVFLGPLGMLYSTIAGGIIMFFINILMLLFTAGFGLLITWPISIVWAAIAARKKNEPYPTGSRYC